MPAFKVSSPYAFFLLLELVIKYAYFKELIYPPQSTPWDRVDSNYHHLELQSSALPLELLSHNKVVSHFIFFVKLNLHY